MISMKCKKFRILAPMALTGEMDDLARRKFDKHLEVCERCRREFDELTATWVAIEIPKQSQITTNSLTQLKLFHNKRDIWNSELLSRVATAAIIAAIIFLMTLPFLIGKQKQDNPNWAIQNYSSAATTKY